MSADAAAAVKPALEDAVAVSSKKQRYIQGGPKSDEPNNTKNKKGPSSLFARCQSVVVANLERYPPDYFGMLTESDWEDIVRCKHRKTAPQKGTGGLDGTGRRTPAIGQGFLAEVEETNSHLADSSVSDLLVWKDCVEFQFSRSGLTRPRALLLPWPLLVKKIADQADILSDWKKKEDAAERDDDGPLEVSEEQSKAIIDATQQLKDSPMNVSLLKESGIGKFLKKIIKASSNRTHKSIFKRLKMTVSGPTSLVAARANSEKELSVLKTLEMLLQTWMDLAASRGVEIQTSAGQKDTKAVELYQQDAEDLGAVEPCKTWRQLFATLKGRAEQRRLNLGQKMRENRKKENSMRPQIVKVRPANPRREHILNRGASSPNWSRGGGTVEKDGGAKILQLRKESAVQAARQKSGLNAFKKKSSGFGAAVAFASTTKLSAKQSMAQQQERKRKAAAIVALGSGKQMAVPQKAMRMQGTKFSAKKVKKNNPDLRRK